MSTYVREKVLRIPFEKLNIELSEEEKNNLDRSIEQRFSSIFDYETVGKFQISPTATLFIDLVLVCERDIYGEYGRTRSLTEQEKIKYLPKFQQISSDVSMDDVRLVEFCWYNGSEAPDYYDETNDSFYNEV